MKYAEKIGVLADASNPKSEHPEPYKFPMKFKKFLQIMFGGRLYADRLHLFRKYLTHQLQEAMDLKHLSPQARDTEVTIRVGNIITAHNRDGVPAIPFGFYCERIPVWRKDNRVAQRRAANQSRWNKEKQKKILELPQNPESVLSQGKKCSLAPKKNKKVIGSHPKK